jgi:ATP/maltotriose-dependent transcriptional regulator MalT
VGVTPAHRKPFTPAFGTPLSIRELQVLCLVAQGLDNRQIAARLFLSEATIKTHLRRLSARLGAVNRAHAVALGFQARVLVPGRPRVAGVPRVRGGGRG